MQHISTRFFVADSSENLPPKAVPSLPSCFLWQGCTPDHPVPVQFRMKLHPDEAILKVPLASDLSVVKPFLLA